MSICLKLLGGICTLLHENRLGIKKNIINFLTRFVRLPARNSVNPIIYTT